MMKTITLTDEEFRELGLLLNMGISDFLDTSFVIGSEKGRREAIRRVNVYKRIYKKFLRRKNENSRTD